MLTVISTLGAIVGFIIKVAIVAAVIFFILCLIATQIMDIYEARTGESWEARCKRLNKKDQEGERHAE